LQVIKSANATVAQDDIVFTIGESDGFVSLDKREGQPDGGDNTQDLIDRRLALIAQKNWAEADRIRDELLAQGIQLKDGKDPVTGERVTTWEVKR
jgi:cysteinyl-tRNA synthetase